MSATHTSLDAAAIDRKARLAKLASLKRKAPVAETNARIAGESVDEQEDDGAENTSAAATSQYLSGRNYDVSTQNAKLGFDHTPGSTARTVEAQADDIAATAAEHAAKDEAEASQGIDLFKLQPKKPNWDLKRDLAEKTKILDVRTQNAIAKLVRERIENAKKEASGKADAPAPAGKDGVEGEEVGIEGNSLVEGIHLREREEERQAAEEMREEDIT